MKQMEKCCVCPVVYVGESRETLPTVYIRPAAFSKNQEMPSLRLVNSLNEDKGSFRHTNARGLLYSLRVRSNIKF